MTPTRWQKIRYLAHTLRFGAPFGAGLAALAYTAAPYTGAPLVLYGFAVLVVVMLGVYGATEWGGAILSICGAHYHTDTPADVDAYTLLTAHVEWVEGRQSVAQKHGTSTTDVLRGARIRLTDERESSRAGTPAAKAWWRTRVVHVAAGDVGTGELKHELSHLLAGALFGGRDDWGDLSHDERIALLDGEPIADEET